jgi:prolipoprotein diacylglyceryltransferase
VGPHRSAPPAIEAALIVATWLRPRVKLLGRSVSCFHVCGVIGLSLGTTLAMFLASQSGLSRAVVGGLLLMGVVTFLALAMGTKIVTGTEALVYYHHEIAILTTSGALLSIAGQPVLPYLDVTALGLGVFLTFGRCGCLLVGCCHGRPYRWGVRYSHAHAGEGFPDCYVGARLFPVQGLEALLVATIVAAGAAMVLRGAPAGQALTWFVVSYSVLRIWLEELRGDRLRPYWLQLSEAQWTSLVLISAIAWSGWQGRVPASWWQVAAVVVAALSLAVLATGRTEARAMLHAHHAGEIAAIVAAPPAAPAGISVRRTSMTVGVSTQFLGRLAGADTMLYSISRANRHLTPPEARALSRLIFNLAGAPGAQHALVPGRHDVFHMIVKRASPERNVIN